MAIYRFAKIFLATFLYAVCSNAMGQDSQSCEIVMKSVEAMKVESQSKAVRMEEERKCLGNEAYASRVADLYAEAGDLPSAKRIAAAIADSRPSSPTGYLIMAQIDAKNKDWEGSLKNATRVYEIKKDPLMLLVSASSLHQLGRHREAVEKAYQALKENENLVSRSIGINEAIYSLGALGRLEEAAQLARRRMHADDAWRRDPTFVSAAVKLKILPAQ